MFKAGISHWKAKFSTRFYVIVFGKECILVITKTQYADACQRAMQMLEQAAITITPEEKKNMQVAEYGLGMLEAIGLQLVVYLNTQRCCAKELVLFPGQTCPEHRHPVVADYPGKEETFRCRAGKVFLYVEGEPAAAIEATLPVGREKYFTARHEIILCPGDQYTLSPDTLHWFQAGPEGAIISEFSTMSLDDHDVYTDPLIDPAGARQA